MKDQNGFVLSGAALLLVLPAMLFVASCFEIMEMGGKGIWLQGIADKVFYTGKDVERVVELVWDENVLTDGKPNANANFYRLMENYSTAAGLLVEVTPRWMLGFTKKEKGENRFAGTKYSKVARIGRDNWRYYFEADDKSPFDFDELILLVTKLAENLRITLEGLAEKEVGDIYYGDTLLWENPPKDSVGETRVVHGTTQLRIFIDIKDPREAARYTSTMKL